VSSDNPMNQAVVSWNLGRLKMGSIRSEHLTVQGH
jgi:hypothetical protein